MLYQGRSLDFKIRQNAFPTEALPRTPLGELTTLPRPPNRMGREYPLPTLPHLALLAPRFSGGTLPPPKYFPLESLLVTPLSHDAHWQAHWQTTEYCQIYEVSYRTVVYNWRGSDWFWCAVCLLGLFLYCIECASADIGTLVADKV